MIVAFQFTAMGRIRGRRRTRVLAVMAVLWAAAWLLLGAGALAPGSALAIIGLLGFGIVFGIGETLLQPTLPAINNDLAADHLRGRYNALHRAAGGSRDEFEMVPRAPTGLKTA